MDLKSRGQRGRSYIQRAIRRVEYGVTKSSSDTVSDNLEDAELTKKVEALFAHEPLFERLHTEPKWRKAYTTSVSGVKHTAHYIKKQKPRTKVFAVLAIAALAGLIYQTGQNSKSELAKKPEVTQVAGITTNSGKLTKETPSFAILKPEGRKFDSLDTVKVSPTGNDPVYAFTDTLDGIEIQVSQQEVPKSFDFNQEVELERVAKDFQATNVIQIDDNKVFHGLSDKTKQQSLIFIKDDLLVFIKSPQKLSDEVWAGYIMGLKKN